VEQSAAARAAIRAWREKRGRRTVVLDDDPTGSQSVHGVQVVTAITAEETANALSAPGSTAFLLTNTRSLSEPDAVELTRAVIPAILGIDADADIVSRSDSTLRGHVLAEVEAIDEARASLTGRRADGVLFAPAFFEAGRFTRDDIHFATIAGVATPVGETEFARDKTFGYAASDLRAFLAEHSGGRVAVDDVLSISLDTIAAGPDAVAEVLMRAHDRAFVVVNAVGYDDYETVVLGVQAAIDAGRSFLYRTGPSFVRALIGLEPRGPLVAADLPVRPPSAGHGLVVVGSHVSQTSRQVAVATAAGGLLQFELSVPRLLDGDPAHLPDTIDAVREGLRDHDVLVCTSRELVAGTDAASSLDIARAVSTAVSAVVAGALSAKPGWVVAKGGITSHDVAVRGLGMRRARVLGQLLPGMVSVFEPLAASEGALGIPYVVFAGNVGDDTTLAHVVDVLRARPVQTDAA